MPGYFLVFFASMAAAAVTGKKTVLGAHWRALAHNLGRIGKIRVQRRLVRRIRKTSDHQIFQKVMKTPRLEYFLKTFQGRLSEYKDTAMR